MKKHILLICYLVFEACAFPQQTGLPADSIPAGYFVTHTRSELMQKLSDLPVGINTNDSIPAIIDKLEMFVLSYQPQQQYKDDAYAKESILQTLIGFKEGGYGIGAILVDSTGNIIFRSHNYQIQKHRSDLHAEMSLLTFFEESQQADQYMNVFVYKPGLTIYSSAEPCPMCLMRMALAGVECKYVCRGPDDGMANRIDYLPPAWRSLAHKYPCTQAQTSPVLQKIAHLMFFSYLLDNRGPE